MMKFINLHLILVLSLYSACVSNISNSKKDQLTTPAPAYQAEFPLQLPFVEVVNVRHILKPNHRGPWFWNPGPTHPRPTHKDTLDKIIFEIRIFVTVIGDSTYFAEPFGVICELPNKNEEIILLNPEGLRLENGVMNEFYFELETKKEGTAHITLAKYDPETDEVYDVDEISPFLHKSILLK